MTLMSRPWKSRTLRVAVAIAIFGGLMENFETVILDPEARVRMSWLHALAKKINTAPSLYLEAGAVHRHPHQSVNSRRS